MPHDFLSDLLLYNTFLDVATKKKDLIISNGNTIQHLEQFLGVKKTSDNNWVKDYSRAKSKIKFLDIVDILYFSPDKFLSGEIKSEKIKTKRALILNWVKYDDKEKIKMLNWPIEEFPIYRTEEGFKKFKCFLSDRQVGSGETLTLEGLKLNLVMKAAKDHKMSLDRGMDLIKENYRIMNWSSVIMMSKNVQFNAGWFSQIIHQAELYNQ